MSKYDFPRIPKKKGSTKDFVPIYVEPEFKIALHHFAERQSAKAGHHVSMSNVVQTSLMQRYPEQIATEYKKLKAQNKEDNHHGKIGSTAQG